MTDRWYRSARPSTESEKSPSRVPYLSALHGVGLLATYCSPEAGPTIGWFTALLGVGLRAWHCSANEIPLSHHPDRDRPVLPGQSLLGEVGAVLGQLGAKIGGDVLA